MILVIDNYDSFTYNLVQLLALLGADVRVERNDAVTPAQVLGMAPKGIVVSPGPGLPSHAGVSEAVIAAAGDEGIPVLGVCLGHQAIAEVYGGRVVRGPVPVHGKTSAVSHAGHDIFQDMPDAFIATRYHSLVVDRETLPDCLEVTAETADGIIMGLRHTTRPVFGVQFHPESVLTPEGIGIISNFLVLTGEIERPAPAAGEEPSSARPKKPPAGLPEGPVTVATAIAAVAAGADLSEQRTR
jgi:anthranilate synthase component 2